MKSKPNTPRLENTPADLPVAATSFYSDRLVVWIVVGALLVFTLLSFRAVWSPARVLFSTDDNMGALMLRKTALPWGFLGWWVDGVLVGVEDVVNLNWTNLLLWLLPVRWFTNWIHALDLFGASLFFMLFLRRRGLNWVACAFGALTAFWLASNFTLTYAGHIGKFGVLMFAALSLWLAERAVVRNRWADWILVGGALAGMYLEQVDVALFFSLVIGPYIVFAGWRENILKGRKFWFGVVVTSVVALLVAFRALWIGYHTGITGVAAIQKEDPQAKWEFLTQWSWPPEESIDFIAPGYMGWRSGEPAGPYWGRMGRSAGWETTRQGFQNFKLENQYLGIIPVFWALWGLWAGWMRRGQAPRGEAIFWGAAAGVTLLLSFGKYFPLYRLFAMLPVVSSIRNPNKFLQVFQLTVGVLAAFGAQSLVAARTEEENRAARTWFVRVLAIATAVLFLSALGATSSMPRDISRFMAEGWGTLADVIIKTRTAALWHAVVMSVIGLAAAIFMVRTKTPRRRGTVAWMTVLVVALDSLWLGRHYVQAVPRDAFAPNPVIRFLKNMEPGRRVALATQQGFYNFLLTYSFPYEGIRAINITQMPRMPVDYEQFLKAVGGNVARLWQLAGVQYVMMPSAMWNNAKNDPFWTNLLEPVYGFDVYPSSQGMYQFVESSVAKGQHLILRFRPPAPFVVPIGAWRPADDDTALRRLADPSHDPLQEVLIPPALAERLKPLQSPGAHGEVRYISERPGYRHIQVATDRDSIVRFAQRYTDDWRAYVDRKPVKLLRCDYLFQGVQTATGLHEITLHYAPPRWPLVVQLLGMALCGLGLMASLRLSKLPPSSS